jgi:hypothetical protein
VGRFRVSGFRKRCARRVREREGHRDTEGQRDRERGAEPH